MAFGSYAMWLFLCALCVNLGLSRYTILPFIIICCLILVMHIAIYAVLRSGLNKRFKDPSLTLFQMMMATVWVMFCIYGATEIRGSMLMLYFVVFIFGVFRLAFSEFMFLSAFGVMSYSAVIGLLYKLHPEEVDIKVELMNLLFLATVLPWFSLIASYIKSLRKKIRKALETIEQLAVTDELTLVHNRRRILEIINEQKALCDRSDKAFSICIFDLDYFKSVNDTYGHEAGDTVLKTMATAISDNIRDIDSIARYGGEEFMLVLSGSVASEAMALAERIRELAASVRYDGMGDFRVTISMGVTEYIHSESVQVMINRADKALYRAKSEGRNRVIMEKKSESRQMYLF